MKEKKTDEPTAEQLQAKKRTLKAIIAILSTLIILYSLFFIYRLTTGTWEANSALGTVALGMLVVVLSTTSVQYSSIAKKVQERSRGN